ncbi:MAG: YkgJ family cysteine cluster protein [Syntrophotaleaceae bacterium]
MKDRLCLDRCKEKSRVCMNFVQFLSPHSSPLTPHPSPKNPLQSPVIFINFPDRCAGIRRFSHRFAEVPVTTLIDLNPNQQKDPYFMKSHVRQYCHVDHPHTWVKYHKSLCRNCRATCCSLPVEVTVDDLVRMELIDPFAAEEPAREIAKKLRKAGFIDHFNFRSEVFTLARRANDDCLFLDQKTRLCTIYQKRPATCRNHPQIGPRPGFCAYQEKS